MDDINSENDLFTKEERKEIKIHNCEGALNDFLHGFIYLKLNIHNPNLSQHKSDIIEDVILEYQEIINNLKYSDEIGNNNGQTY